MKPEITVNTQSSIRIQTAETVIRFDPFKIAGEPHDADIIFITHDHYDHFSPEDIRKVSRPDTLLVAPKSMKKALAKHGFTDPVLLAPGESAEVRHIPVEAVASYNLMKPFHPKSKGWVGYIINSQEHGRSYIAGDTDITSENQQVKCDIALLPAGGTYTMNAKKVFISF